jgi:uncharacterized membrane protein
MKFEKKEIIAILIIIILFLIAFYVYPKLPDKVPVHWNAKGEIDGYGSRFIGVFLFPLIILGIYLLIAIIPRIAVFKENIKLFQKHFYGMKLAFVLFFGVIYISTLLPNFWYKFNIGRIIMPALAILFYYVGYIMKFAKRNFFIGIRTPWTLSNDNVWDKIHKIGSVTFRINALIFILGIFIPKYFIWIVLIPILANVIFLFFYSYFLYKKEVN